MILCVDPGHVSPSEFYDVLEYEDAVRLASRTMKIRNERQKSETEYHGAIVNALTKSNSAGFTAVCKSIGNLQDTIVRAFRPPS